MDTARVALVRSENRYDNVAQALAHIATGVDLGDKQRVLVKPNMVVTHEALGTTHADALRAVLDFVRARYNGPLTIAEGPAVQPAAEGFARFGFESLAAAYDARLLDLNDDEAMPVQVYDWRLRPLRVHLARTVVESDWRISVGPPKTHDAVIVTLSLKNMIMGALISHHARSPLPAARAGLSLGGLQRFLWHLVPGWVRHLPPLEWLQFRVMSTMEPSDKMKMHQSYPVINLNLALLAPRVAPHLAVVDAFEAMEGNGPTLGTPVPLHLALASTDPIAADVVGAALMGFDAAGIGYLNYCARMGLGTGDLARIEIVGNTSLAACARQFRPHDTYRRQQRWHLPGADAFLGVNR